ncbi:MAG: hypothetical protein SGJ09_13380 [Phycisphaerae bacterium]|nr:hypothetical protein [Phycisphaerae bacterium]
MHANSWSLLIAGGVVCVAALILERTFFRRQEPFGDLTGKPRLILLSAALGTALASAALGIRAIVGEHRRHTIAPDRQLQMRP